MRSWSRAAAVALAAATAAACHTESVSVTARIGRPNILLVTIDTFRADRLGQNVTPALDRLAASAWTFTSARAAAPLTLPSHTTILTGLLPPAHGVRENGIDTLSDAHPTVARLLKAHGYRTAAFVGAFVLDRRFGLANGFDDYDDRIPRDPKATEQLEAERPASAVVDAALRWLNPEPPALNPQPFFLWVHLYDPHAPYRPPAGFSGYDGEIAYADSQIARVFARLKQPPFSDTLIVVAGDHGEGLGDHGEQTHGMLLYDSTLRVPLIIAAPGQAGGRRDEPVSLADIAPTILRAAGVEPPKTMAGRNLLGGGGASEVYAETEYPRVAGWSPLQALSDGRWKTIRAGRETEVYDLRADPGETTNLASSQASTASAMATRIDTIRAGAAPRAGAPTLNKDAEERLRSLGYVAASASSAPAGNAPNPSRSIGAWNRFEETLGLLSAQPADAIPSLTRLAAEHPGAPVFQTTYARALKDAGRPAEALTVYRKAARQWPTDAALLHDLAVAARDAAGRADSKTAAALLDEAVRADSAALVLSPSSAMARNGLGLLAIDQRRPADAVREFTKATTLDANNPWYWTNLGNALRETGDAAGAEQAYRRALDADGRAVDAANGLGVLLIEAKRPGEAVPWFERAIEGSPDFAEARLNLGIAQQQSGDPGRAADTYRAILAAPGNHPREKEAARQLLASLGNAR